MNTPEINDGGPAFPTPDSYDSQTQKTFRTQGMSLRDWYASMPLNETEIQCVRLQYEAAHPESKATYTLSEARFFHADAMLAQRNKK